jgi:excisionase family DNA binding protein
MCDRDSPVPGRNKKMRATPEEHDAIMAQTLCTVTEAAKVLRIGRTHAYKLIDSGELRSIRSGRRVLVPTDAIGEYIAKRLDAA